MDLPENIDDLVSQYIALRDKLKEADEAHKQKTKAAREYLDQLNNHLLSRLNDVGGNSVQTDHGTVYRTTRRSASITDGDAFRGYVIDNQQFDLVDWRANAIAVDDYIKEHSAPPPGVNFTTAFTVGVRRS